MLWASAADGGAEWCGHTSTRNTSAGQKSSSLTVVAQAGTAGCRRVIHYRNPAACQDERRHQRLENGSAWEQIGERFVADEVRQSRHRRAWWCVTSSTHQWRRKQYARGLFFGEKRRKYFRLCPDPFALYIRRAPHKYLQRWLTCRFYTVLLM